MIKYVAILSIDALWVYVFFSTYLRGGEISGFFALFMFVSWYIFNMFCALFIEDRQIDKNENENPTEQYSLTKQVLTFTIPKVKYLAIAIINIISITLITRFFVSKEVFPWLGLLILLIYDLFNLFLIVSTNRVKTKEFYRILLVVCPLIIGFIWILIS